MIPINYAERKSAFLNFLLFFVITIAAIITVVFFSVQVPFAENRKMKEQIISYQNEQAFASQFSAKINDLQTLIDTLGTPNTSTELLNNQINSMLTDLQVQKDKVMSGNDNIYAKTLHALYDLESAKYSLIKSGMQSQDMGRLQQEKESLTQRINDANNYIAQLSASVKLQPPYRSF